MGNQTVRRLGCSTVVAVFLCVLGCTPHRDYVLADAKTYGLLAPHTKAGIEVAPVSAEMRQDLMNLLRSWEARVRLAGGFEELAEDAR